MKNKLIHSDNLKAIKANEKDISTKNRKSWSKSTIWGILRNPIYDSLLGGVNK